MRRFRETLHPVIIPNESAASQQALCRPRRQLFAKDFGIVANIDWKAAVKEKVFDSVCDPMRRGKFSQLGDELLGVMRKIKRMFDPKNIFNPGKIFEIGIKRLREAVPYKIDNHLRENFTRPLELPLEPVLAFAFKDRSFIGNLEQCNGCGGCLKQTGIMCPTFMATHEEVMSTRGRANIIRAAGIRVH